MMNAARLNDFLVSASNCKAEGRGQQGHICSMSRSIYASGCQLSLYISMHSKYLGIFGVVVSFEIDNVTGYYYR